MAYKKPEVVAKSEAKESFVAGCTTHNVPMTCRVYNNECHTVGIQ